MGCVDQVVDDQFVIGVDCYVLVVVRGGWEEIGLGQV